MRQGNLKISIFNFKFESSFTHKMKNVNNVEKKVYAIIFAWLRYILALQHSSKRIEGARAIFYSTVPCPDFEYQPIASETQLQKSSKQFDSRRKRTPQLGPGSCFGCTSIHIH